jgi:purine-binding chemotaxis protein CheW
MSSSYALPEDRADSKPGAEHLTFTLGDQVYAFALAPVREIIGYGHITSVPMMHSAVLGVTNLRGAVVPVVDLATRLGRPAGPITRKTCIVIVEQEIDEEKSLTGVLVDRVIAVQSFAPEAGASPPEPGAPVVSRLIAGIDPLSKLSERSVMLLDIAQLLSIGNRFAAGEVCA